MPAKPAKTDSRSIRLPASASLYCSVFPADGIPVEAIGYSANGGHRGEFKPELDWAFEKSRWWKKFNWFVGAVHRIRIAFYSHGFKLRPVGNSGDKAAFASWYQKNQDLINAYADDVWDEWVTIDNAISFWFKGCDRPIVIPPENVKYTDFLGRETLKFKGLPRGVSTQDIPERIRKIYEDKNAMTISGSPDKSFKVLKREKLGWGLAWPSMTGILKVCDQVESQEVGDQLWAYMTRTPYEHHLLGHEIKSGQFAGYPTHFIKKKRADALKEALTGITGATKLIGNFDHTIKYVSPDPKFFDGSKYEGAIRRLSLWAMPIGQMVVERGGVPNPNTLLILKAVATSERARVKAHLDYVINAAFKPPVPVECVWGNRIFKDLRLAADLLKFALKAGPLSQTTFLKEADCDPEEERAFKAEEDQLPKSHTLPLHDPDHGAQPTKMAGRKPGSGNKRSDGL